MHKPHLHLIQSITEHITDLRRNWLHEPFSCSQTWLTRLFLGTYGFPLRTIVTQPGSPAEVILYGWKRILGLTCGGLSPS